MNHLHETIRRAGVIARQSVANIEATNADYPHHAIDITLAQDICVGIARVLERYELGLATKVEADRLIAAIEDLNRITAAQRAAIDAEQC